MHEYFKCWGCKKKKWMLKTQLEKRVNEPTHIDYDCPICGRTVICQSLEPQETQDG